MPTVIQTHLPHRARSSGRVAVRSFVDFRSDCQYHSHGMSGRSPRFSTCFKQWRARDQRFLPSVARLGKTRFLQRPEFDRRPGFIGICSRITRVRPATIHQVLPCRDLHENMPPILSVKRWTIVASSIIFPLANHSPWTKWKMMS